MTDANSSTTPSLQQDIDAAKALFAHPPTLRGAVLATIQDRFFTQAGARTDAANLCIGTPDTTWQYSYRPLVDVVIERFIDNLEPAFTDNHRLENRPGGVSIFTYPLNAAAFRTLIDDWGDNLLDLYQQALVDYWNEEDASGSSRTARLSTVLFQIFENTKKQFGDFLKLGQPGVHLSIYGVHALSRDSLGGRYPERLPCLVVRRKEKGVEQAPLVLSLAFGAFRVESTDLRSVVPLLMSRWAEGRDIEYAEHLLWQEGDPDEHFNLVFPSLCEALLDNQLQAISLIARNLNWKLEDYQRELDLITGVDQWFLASVPVSPHSVVELPEDLARLSDAMPHWLLVAPVEDLGTYRGLLNKLAQVQRASNGRAFLDDIGDMPGFAAAELLKKMQEDHPGDQHIPDPRDVRLAIDKTTAVAIPVLGGGAQGVVEKVHKSLVELVLDNLGGFRHSKISVSIRHCSVESAVPDWLTADYIKKLVTSVDIGRTYLERLKAKLVDEAGEALRREKLFAEQLRVQLPMAALELKIRNEAGFDDVGFRYVEAVLQAEAASQRVNGQQIVMRPLAFKAEADAKADEVASMFLIGPKDTGKGPFILYRPLLAQVSPHAAVLQDFQAAPDIKDFCPEDRDVKPVRPVEPLRQYPTFSTVLDAIREAGPLQDSVLAWMSDEARRTYDHGGFFEPHLRRSVEDDFAAFLPVVPATLAEEVVQGDVLHHLFVSTATTLIAQADRQSVSNAEVRWNTLKEGGWQLFNVLLMFVRGPAAVTGWIFAAVASIDTDLQRLEGKDPGAKASAWADILVNMAFILGHRSAHGGISDEVVPQTPIHEAYRPSGRVTVSEGPDQPIPMNLENPLAPTDQPPSRRTILDWAMKSYPLPWPESHTLGEVIEEGDYRGLIYLKKGRQLAARIGGWVFAVMKDEEGHVRVTTSDGSEQGFYLKPLGDGRWLPDLKPRLRGGSGRSGSRKTEYENTRQAKTAVLDKKIKIIKGLINTSVEAATKIDEQLTELEEKIKNTADTQARQKLEADSISRKEALLNKWGDVYEYLTKHIKALEDLNKVKPSGDFQKTRCFELGAQLDICRKQLLEWEETRELGRPPQSELEQARVDESGLDSDLFKRTKAFLQRKMKINEQMLEWHKREQQIRKELTEISVWGEKTLKEGSRSEKSVTLLQTQSSQLHALSSLNVYELGEKNPDILFGSEYWDALLANSSQLNLETNTELSEEHRREVLSTCIDSYESVAETVEFRRQLVPESESTPYTERLLQLLRILQEDALEALGKLLGPKALDEDFAVVPPPAPRSGLIRARGPKGGLFLGKVRAPAVGETKETIEIGPRGEELLFQDDGKGGEWEQVKVTGPALPVPKVTTKVSLDRLLASAKEQMKIADQELDSAMRQAIKVLDKSRQSQSPVKDPVFLQEILEGKSKQLDERAGQLDKHLVSFAAESDKSKLRTQATDLRALAERLRSEGLRIRIDATKASRPDMNRVDFLQRKGEIEIRKMEPRSKLKPDDYLQEYVILDNAEGRRGELLWVAHFHYKRLGALDELFTAGHLKLRAQRFLGAKAEIQAEAERLKLIRSGQPGRARAALEVWRSSIRRDMAHEFFFKALPVDEALAEQFRRL